MTRLRCVCGVVVEGSEEGLLDAVERHLAESHTSVLDGSDGTLRRGIAPIPGVTHHEVAQLDDERPESPA